MGEFQRDRAGFTLIELSIVLVIIGLIVGGVLVGRDLIKAATLRSVITDIDKFNAATMTFLGKYNCLPGDCANATALFGTYSSPRDCTYEYVIPPGSGTCNGNGNGRVSGASGNFWALLEPTLFWQQLSIAGLAQANYGGGTDSDGVYMLGISVPVSKVEGGCYGIEYSDNNPFSENVPYFAMDAHYFAFGANVRYGGTPQTTPSPCAGGLSSLMAVDAQSLDKKIDDGLPMSGIVTAPLWLRYGSGRVNDAADSGCLTGNFSYGSVSLTYDSATANTPCELFFKAAF